AAGARARASCAPAIPAPRHRHTGHIARGTLGRLPHTGEVAGPDVVLRTVLHAGTRSVRNRHGSVEDAAKIDDADEEHEQEREQHRELHDRRTSTPLGVWVSVTHALFLGLRSPRATLIMGSPFR